MVTARAAANAWNAKSLVPNEELGWDTVEARLFRYSLNEAYYNNIVYTNLNTYAIAFKQDQKLYRHIRGIYNPVQRLVELYVAKVYGGQLDLQTMTKGAIPILEADDVLREAIKTVFLSSNWRSQKSLYVRQGAQYGDAFIKVLDLPAKQKTRMEVLNPRKVYDADFDEIGNITRIVIRYQIVDPEDPEGKKTAIYTEIIDKEWFKTYKDDKPFAYNVDMTGTPIPEWPNLYGFVPVVQAMHRDMGLKWGASAFSGSPRPKIDEINDQSSVLNDQIRKVVNPIWAMIGVNAEEGVVFDLKKEETPMVYLPPGSDAKPLVAPIDIAAASANIQKLLAELENDLPELALHRLREQGNLTAPGVQAGYADAADRIIEAQGNYDDALIRAVQMAISIGALGRYPGYQSYNLDSFKRGDLGFTIQERPVFADNLSKKERLDMLRQISIVPDRAILAELDIDEDTIQEWEQESADKAAQLESQMFGAANQLAAGQQQGQDQGQPQDMMQLPAQTGGSNQ